VRQNRVTWPYTNRELPATRLVSGAPKKSVSPFGADHPVVFRVRANPDPNHPIGRLYSERTVVISYANAEPILTALQFAEMKRRMVRVALP
jgi:hypothetical protein